MRRGPGLWSSLKRFQDVSRFLFVLGYDFPAYARNAGF